MSDSSDFFTPQQPPTASYKSCPRCQRTFSITTQLYYVSAPDGDSARWCCAACAEHYRLKRGGLPTSLAQVPLVNDFTQRKTDISEAQLKRASSASQRGAPIYPAQRFGAVLPPIPTGGYAPAVQNHLGPLSRPSLSMVPPPALALQTGSQTSTEFSGYTQNHQMYGQHRAKMVSQVHEFGRHVTVSTAMHSLKPEGKSGTVLVGNIEGDLQVPPTISRVDLFNTTCATLRPLWDSWAAGYPFPLYEMEMYKQPKLLLFDPAHPNALDPQHQAIYEFYWSTKSRASVPSFNPSKRITILLIIKHELHREVLDWKEDNNKDGLGAVNSDAEDDGDDIPEMPGLPNSEVDCILGVSSKGKGNSDTKSKRARSRSMSQPAGPTSKRKTPTNQAARNLNQIPEDSEGDASLGVQKDTASGDQPPVIPHSEKTRCRADTEQRIVGPALNGPSTSKLQNALAVQDRLRTQAKSISKQIAIQVQLYPIPAIDFDTLLDGVRFAVDLNDVTNRFLVELFVDASTPNRIGNAGSFKTTHPAHIKLSHNHSEDDTGTILNVPAIVAKRLFVAQQTNPSDSTQTPRIKRVRMKATDELPQMLDEANCLHWGAALMTQVYNFVDNTLGRMSRASIDKAGLNIPRLRFVLSALAVPCNFNADPVYLLEERISDSFTKYIINSRLEPMADLIGPARDIADFLCFAQHVQYHLSDGQVFISDFQGGSKLLTDCQVITSGEYDGNFGIGNLSSVLERFESDHKCNRYCKFFKLEPYDPPNPTRNSTREDSCESDSVDDLYVPAGGQSGISS